MKLTQKIAVSYLRTKFRLLAKVSRKKAAVTAFDLFCTPMYRNLNELPVLYKESEKLNFRFQDFNIRGYRWNKGGKSRLLIIHGFESSVINFDKYVKAFIQKGYEVLAFDAPAHGRSSGKKINALLYRDFIKYILQQYGPVQKFMAHSFGGLSLSIALAELKHDDQTRAVYIAPATETATAISQFFHYMRITDPEVRTHFEQIIIEMADHPVSWYSIGRALENIYAKILWIHDEDDRITPIEDARKVKKMNFPNVKFVFTKGLGHSRIYRNPDVRKLVTDFL